MITMAQRPIDPDQIQMAMPPETVAPAPVKMAVDPHATLTAPISPAPIAAAANDTPSRMSLAPQEEHLGKRLMADYKKDNDPYGSPDNHPGFFGKLLHGLSYATGGTTRRGWEEQGLENRLQNLGKEESEQALQAAQAGNQTAEAGKNVADTGLVTEETKDLPQKNAAEIALQQAQAYRAIHPLATSAFDLWHQQNPNATAQDYETMMQKPLSPDQAATMNGVWDKIASKYGLPTGQFKSGMPASDANALSAALNNVVSRGQGAQNITIRQQQVAEKVPMFSPDGKGGYTLQYIQPGETITPGSMTPTQGGNVSAPTTTEKNAGAQGQLVHEQIPGLIDEIDKNASQMGPILGHWNEFMQGKVGLENPQFATLRANLMMASSAVALAHARGRLPENLREEFDRMINAPQQSPENLKAVLLAIDPWMVKMGDMGSVQGLSAPGSSSSASFTPPSGAPDPAKLPDGKVLFKKGTNTPIAKTSGGKWVAP